MKGQGKAGDDYTCSYCRGVFERTRDDDDPELLKEHEENFGSQDIADSSLVCDDCYQKLMASLRAADFAPLAELADDGHVHMDEKRGDLWVRERGVFRKASAEERFKEVHTKGQGSPDELAYRRIIRQGAEH